MNKVIELYIEPAMQELQAESKKAGKIAKEYKGYIASLGASIIMSGLIPTLAFYSSKENSAKGDRSQVLRWITNILKIQAPYNRSTLTDLFKYAREGTTDCKRLEQDILDVSVALKLCIRTFELTK